MKRPSPPGKRLLCLWLPNWPIQRLRTSLASDAPDPHLATLPREPLRAAPLVLWGSDPRRGRLVVACCDRAVSRGVRVGMTVGEADSLVHAEAQGPGISEPHQILQHDSEADLEALRSLAEACAAELSPIVALEPLDAFLWAGQILHQPQSLLLDVTGVGELFGGEPRLAAAALDLLRSNRLEGRIGIADTAGAAWGFAHYGLTADEAIAGQSSDVCLVPPGQTRTHLGPLSVAALRIRPETAVMLRRLGVERIDALLRLPRSGLATRLGADLLRRLDQALGDVDEPLPAHHAAAADRASIDLEYPTRDLDILRHPLAELVRRVARGLSDRQRGALRLSCRFKLEKPPMMDREMDREKPPAVEIRLGLFTPSANPEYLLRLLSENLERLRFPSPADQILLAATLTGPLAMHQPTLGNIGGGEQGSRIDLARLIDGLSSRLGRHRVLGVELTDNPLPEQALRLRPLAGQPVGAVVPGRPAGRSRRDPGKRHSPACPAPACPVPERPAPACPVPARPAPASLGETPGSGVPTPADPLRRPLMMLSQPAPLTVFHSTAPIPQSQEIRSLPERFQYRGRVHHIVRHWGPERLETGWWSGPMHRRDYYRIETDEGSWMWIYCDLRQDRWWLHGYFL